MFIQGLDIIAMITNMIAIIIIIYGVMVSLVTLLQAEIKIKSNQMKFKAHQKIRSLLGSYILMGLEFLIAADIIETIAHPDIKEMVTLVAIVVVRTFISYFLNKEIESLHHEG